MSKSETVLITGASSGIGLELARCFAADKSNLILVARSREALEKLAGELRVKHGIQVHVIIADLSRPEAPREIFKQTSKTIGTVDVLVNNAGFGLHGAFSELPLLRQTEMVQVNIAALMALTALYLPAMRQQGRGGILNVGSVAGFVPGPYMAVYYATKAFVLSFSEALFEELRGSGVTVTDLCPGPTETNFSQVARSHRVRENSAAKMSAKAVAVAGHRDFRAGRCLSIPGASNVLLAKASRLAPRSAIRKAVAKYNRLK